MKYSVGELLSFLDYVVEKGLQAEATAKSRKTAATKVLEAVDDAEKQDLRSLDREAAFTRFMNLNKKTYSPESFQVYRSRFNSALDDFLRYAEDPSSFRPVASPKTSRSRAAGENGKSASKGRSNEPEKKGASAAAPVLALPAPEPMLEIPVPLSDGKIARLLLPKALKKSDADRISALVAAYAVDG